MKINWNNPAKEYLLYALLLGITLLYPFLHMGEKALDGEAFQWSYLFQQWVKTLPFVVLLLIHIFVLLPVLLDKKQTGKYILKVSGPVIIDTLIGVLLLGCSLAIKLMFKHTESIRKMNELENIHIKQELEQLRTQVSPHFLMNSLNNIHGMVEMDKQKAQDMILELSGMMRYMLYESSVPMISLSREIDFLSNYISLMRARYNSNRVAIQYTFPSKEEVSCIQVPPSLFIILIENAFKHGIDYQNDSFVNVGLFIREGRIHLHCMNSFHESPQKEDVGGIGLANLRKRLDIQYGESYSLEMSGMNSVFITTLTIPVSHED